MWDVLSGMANAGENLLHRDSGEAAGRGKFAVMPGAGGVADFPVGDDVFALPIGADAVGVGGANKRDDRTTERGGKVRAARIAADVDGTTAQDGGELLQVGAAREIDERLLR